MHINKQHFSTIIFFLIILILQSCRTSYKVVPVTDDAKPSKRGGIYYALPQTVLIIDVTMTAIENIKGPYSDFAKKYLGLSNVITANNTIYKIHNINISSTSEPDSSQFYLIEDKGKGFKKKTPLLLGLNESGIIQYINNNKDDSNIYIQPQIKTVNSLKPTVGDYFIHYAGINLTEITDTIFEKVTKDTITFEKQILKKTLIEKTLEQRASDAADYILKLNESRYNLLSGMQEIPYSKEVMEYMCNNLENLEKEYLCLFTGSTKSKETLYRYYYTPSSSTPDITVPLFRFSDEDGVIDLSNTRGQLVFMEVIKKRSTDVLNRYLINTEKYLQNKKINKYKGIFYRIPETARISVVSGDRILTDTTMQISQYGPVTHLPLKNYKIRFWPNTGSIKTINVVK